MNTYLFIGGAYGDDYWTQNHPPCEHQMQVWWRGELLIFKSDADLRFYQPDGAGGWEVVRSIGAAKE